MEEAEQLFLKSLKWLRVLQLNAGNTGREQASPRYNRVLHYTHFSSVDEQRPDVYATETAGETSASLRGLGEPQSTPGTPLWAI